MFERELYTAPGGLSQPIKFMSDSELLRTYKSILGDSGGAGVFEPVAEGIRSIWRQRHNSKWHLCKIEKRFRNIRRRWSDG